MAYVTVPKDLTRVKSKIVFGLTKRQLICFGSGALIGVPLFFFLRGSLGTSTAALVMVLTMLPFFFLAMYERNGQPLEKVVRQFVRLYFLRPKKRPYKTNNFYAALARQEAAEEEAGELGAAGHVGRGRRRGAGQHLHDHARFPRQPHQVHAGV